MSLQVPSPWIVLALLCACTAGPTASPDSGPPACAGLDAGASSCPGAASERCELEVLRTQHAQCASDADCVLVSFPSNCLGFAQCEPRPAVSTADEQAYRSAVTSRLSAFCAQATCQESGSCAPARAKAVCAAGRCSTGVSFPDAGP